MSEKPKHTCFFNFCGFEEEKKEKGKTAGGRGRGRQVQQGRGIYLSKLSLGKFLIHPSLHYSFLEFSWHAFICSQKSGYISRKTWKDTRSKRSKILSNARTCYQVLQWGKLRQEGHQYHCWPQLQVEHACHIDLKLFLSHRINKTNDIWNVKR